MAGAVRVDFSACPPQSRSFRALQPGSRVCNAWGRGVGKSHFARQSMWVDVARYDYQSRDSTAGSVTGIRQVLLMPTLKQFKKVYEREIEDDLGPNGKWGFLGAKINRTDWKIAFPGGSWIQVVSAVNLDDNRGIRCDKVVIDECDDIDTSAYEAVCIPWFSAPWSLDIRLFSGTPRRGRHGLLWKSYSVWPNGDAEHEPLPNHFGFHATYRDAPKIVRQAMVEEGRRTMSPDRFAREWECNFDSGEGLVYPYFYETFHVRKPPGLYAFHEYIVGFDYGFIDPSVFVVIGIAGTGRDTVCHVLREIYVTGKSDSELAAIGQTIERDFPHAKWYCDHHPSTIAEFKRVHIDAHEADKGRVEDGVQFVADAISIRVDSDKKRWAQFYVDPSCKRLIEEFGMYRRKRDPSDKERVLEQIDTSRYDHGLDAVRYALVSHFVGPDRRVTIG